MRTTGRAAMRGVLAGVALVLLGAPLASPAAAHTDLVSSTPAPGATVGAGITDLTLTFSTPLVAEGTQILVRDPGGGNHASSPSALGPQARVQLAALSRPGTYSVVYRVVAGDGHPVSGTFEFRVAGAREAAAAGSTGGTEGTVPLVAQASTPTGSGSPASGWLFAGLGASGAAALLIVGAVRRPEDEEPLADDDRP